MRSTAGFGSFSGKAFWVSRTHPPGPRRLGNDSSGSADCEVDYRGFLKNEKTDRKTDGSIVASSAESSPRGSVRLEGLFRVYTYLCIVAGSKITPDFH